MSEGVVGGGREKGRGVGRERRGGRGGKRRRYGVVHTTKPSLPFEVLENQILCFS